MTVFNLGSVNADHFYRLPHLPRPGETLAVLSYGSGLGGKGANQSVALARAGVAVRHIGAVGADGGWMAQRLSGAGVDCRHLRELPGASGHAIIEIDAAGENAILIHPGVNRALTPALAEEALTEAQPGDWLVLQNETSAQAEAAGIAAGRGMKIVYSAAPFEAEAVRAVLEHVSVLILNEVEAAQLSEAFGLPLMELPVPVLVVTLGGRGALWHDLEAQTTLRAPAFAVTPVDTTGAGDTFAGYLVAGLSQGLSPQAALRLASGAAALKVTRAGTADAIPARAEVEEFLATQPSE